MRSYLLPLTAALGLSACAPRALYFHESTKVAFAADYNTSDSQPLSTSFGYKRRIVAVVPSQVREIAGGGSERDGTNDGEALSLVSKFAVRAGTGEGIHITNNFASGMAARIMTRSGASPEALNVLLNSTPIEVSVTTGETIDGVPAAQAVNERLARNLAKIRRSDVPAPTGGLGRDSEGKLRRKNGASSDPAAEKKEATRTSDVPLPTGGLKRDANGNLIRTEGASGNPAGKAGSPGADQRPQDVPAPTGGLERDASGRLRRQGASPAR